MQQQQPYVVLRLRDGSGSTAFVKTNMKAGAERDAAHSAATQLASYISAISDAVVEWQELMYPAVVVPRPEASGLAPASAAGLFVFSGTDPDSYMTLSIPALRADRLLTTGPGAHVLINPDDPAVIALVAHLTDGDYCNPFAVPIAELEAAYLQIVP